jgi:hypothetical protein
MGAVGTVTGAGGTATGAACGTGAPDEAEGRDSAAGCALLAADAAGREGAMRVSVCGGRTGGWIAMIAAIPATAVA